MKALTVTASIVLSALLLCIAWLVFFPGDAGEPVVTVAVTPPPPKPPAPPPAPKAPAPSINLPPGFGISPVRPQSGPGGAAGAQQQQAGTPAQPGEQGQPQPVGVQTVAVPPPVAPPPGLPPPPDSETASITLVDVPVAELVEQSQYGPLPKVAPDGRRPIDVYARPSKYAVKAAPGEPPRIAVLINGMGLSDAATAEVIKGLPAPVSVAYGAYSRNIQDWVAKTRSAGHEVLLQIPLEPLDYPTNDPGPHTLLTTLPPEENLKRLQWLMSRFTGYVGITNLMGGKFEPTQASFVPVLEELKARGLLFVDDGSVKDSAGGQIAGAIGLDYAIADVQIDAVPSPDDIAKALARLEATAKEKGSAIGIASAKPATIKALAQWAAQLQAKNIILIPVSAAIRSQRQS
ncbi:MAG TPA: divergent polysaccharide deacetylase family protein [Methyloceanibacter sp.]|nr:divergent polysaccharide deacetylase family protein [Methyloceanibacter sp.]